MIQTLKDTYARFPAKFWVLILAVFIDLIGGTMLNPFFALYITSKFNVGMTTAGVLLGMLAFCGLIGNMISGVLVDHFGRRNILLAGLILSALSALSLGFVNSLAAMYPLIIVVGVLSNFGGPARDTMVADLLPEEKRNEGYGILRVAANISWIIGPSVGGLVASHSFLMLFILDALFSSITAVVVYKQIPETKPEPTGSEEKESLGQTLLGYRFVIKDFLFMVYLVVSMIMLLVYQQEYNALSVYMRDVHHFPSEQYGLMLSVSAVVVVLLQISITRKTANQPPFLMMALGSVFYVVGFSMFGFVQPYYLFIAAIVVITIGEMIIAPVGQALAAKFAPEEMRGRYMAFFSVAWALPNTVGPWAAGLIMDNYDPNWVWYLGGILLAISVLGFYGLHLLVRHQPRFSPSEPAVPVDGQIEPVNIGLDH
jgi:MFS family permease